MKKKIKKTRLQNPKTEVDISDFYFRYLAEPRDFKKWKSDFEEKSKAILNNIYDNYGGYAPESPTFERLTYWILRACYDAGHFKNIAQLKRDRQREIKETAIFNRDGEIKATLELRKLIKAHPRVTEWIASYWRSGVFGQRSKMRECLQGRSDLDILKHNLDEIDSALKLYSEKAHLFAPRTYGCLILQRPQKRERKFKEEISNPARDGLIFELTLLLRRYVSKKPILGSMELPRGGSGRQFQGHNEIITKLINLTLGTHLTFKKVAQRLDWLVRNGAKDVGWEQYYLSPEIPSNNKALQLPRMKF